MESKPAIVAHGGAGAPMETVDGCAAAARAGLAKLLQRCSSLDAVVTAVVALEDDGRFNAGSGADLRLDGETIEVDAAVMDSRGCLGAVACMPAVRNPVLVARAVGSSPHWLLAGRGALEFAQVMELNRPVAISERARREHRALLRRLAADAGGRSELAGVDNDAFRRFWNYPVPWTRTVEQYAHGTVGAVARDADGHFAVATSTGGSAPALDGRVGDTPIIGCGFYAGDQGAIAVTGVGEFIVPRLLAKTVYDWIARGEPLQPALERAVKLIPTAADVGLIGITLRETAACSNRSLPHAAADAGEEG